MRNEELKVLGDLASELLECRESFGSISAELASEKASHQNDIAVIGKMRIEMEELRKTESSIAKIKEERDSAQRKLYEAVRCLEKMWQDYKCIRFKDKASRARAREIGTKIKKWSDDMELHLELGADGRWYAK